MVLTVLNNTKLDWLRLGALDANHQSGLIYIKRF